MKLAFVAVCALSARKSRANSWPTSPSAAYIRVLPFGSFVTAISVRSVLPPVSGLLICVQVAPAFIDRQTPTP